MKRVNKKGEYTSPKLELFELVPDVLVTSGPETFDNVVGDPGEFSFGGVGGIV